MLQASLLSQVHTLHDAIPREVAAENTYISALLTTFPQEFLQVASGTSRDIQQARRYILCPVAFHFFVQYLFQHNTPRPNSTPAYSIQVEAINQLANTQHAMRLIDIDIIQHRTAIKTIRIANTYTLAHAPGS